MGCVAIGDVFTLPVFQQPMAADTGRSRTGISLATTLNFLAMGMAAFFWGMALPWGRATSQPTCYAPFGCCHTTT